MTVGRSSLYPPLEPYDSGYLPVTGGQEIYWEQSGNPDGKPVVFLHGGPGSGTRPGDRRFFDPTHYRIVLFDQRGSGYSRPPGTIDDNTTTELLEDIESLRNALGIERWLVVGGSWGSTLGLAYSLQYPDRAVALVIWGVFLGRSSELDNAYAATGTGSQIRPEGYKKFLAALPSRLRNTPLPGYWQLITEGTETDKHTAAREWTRWEETISRFDPTDAEINAAIADASACWQKANIELYYHLHNDFVDGTAMLAKASRLRLPVRVISGRYDLICPMTTAFSLVEVLRSSSSADVEHHIAINAGHSSQDEPIAAALVACLDALATST